MRASRVERLSQLGVGAGAGAGAGFRADGHVNLNFYTALPTLLPPRPQSLPQVLPGRVPHAFPTVPRARPRPVRRGDRGARSRQELRRSLLLVRLVLPHPERGGPAVREGVLRSRGHSLRSVGWGPPPGIEDGGVAAGGDPATPRWAWAGARGSMEPAAAWALQEGREKCLCTSVSFPLPSAPVAGSLCSLSPSFSNYLHRHPSSDLGSLFLTPISHLSLSYSGSFLPCPAGDFTHQQHLIVSFT